MDELSLVFGALSDPTRRAILARLIQGEATVAELARPFSISLPAVSKHLKVLEEAGLIKKRVVAQTRPCRVEGEPLKRAAEYVDMFRQAWMDREGQVFATLARFREPNLHVPLPLHKDPRQVSMDAGRGWLAFPAQEI